MRNAGESWGALVERRGDTPVTAGLWILVILCALMLMDSVSFASTLTKSGLTVVLSDLSKEDSRSLESFENLYGHNGKSVRVSTKNELNKNRLTLKLSATSESGARGPSSLPASAFVELTKKSTLAKSFQHRQKNAEKVTNEFLIDAAVAMSKNNRRQLEEFVDEALQIANECTGSSFLISHQRVNVENPKDLVSSFLHDLTKVKKQWTRGQLNLHEDAVSTSLEEINNASSLLVLALLKNSSSLQVENSKTKIENQQNLFRLIYLNGKTVSVFAQQNRYTPSLANKASQKMDEFFRQNSKDKRAALGQADVLVAQNGSVQILQIIPSEKELQLSSRQPIRTNLFISKLTSRTTPLLKKLNVKFENAVRNETASSLVRYLNELLLTDQYVYEKWTTLTDVSADEAFLFFRDKYLARFDKEPTKEMATWTLSQIRSLYNGLSDLSRYAKDTYKGAEDYLLPFTKI